MAGSMSKAITALTEGQKAIQAAAAQQAREGLPALRLKGGLKPSVRETKAWIEKVSEKLQDVAGLSQLLEDFLRDPKAYTKADMHGFLGCASGG